MLRQKKEQEAGQGVLGTSVVEERRRTNLDMWVPKTELGRKVKSGEIKDIDELLDTGIRILEHEIVDGLIPNLETNIIAVGQSKGKFGGGKRSIWKQTQKKTSEGNKPKFSTVIAIGNKDGYVGIGIGKAKETVPARQKATRKAKLNIIKVRRGCGSWECVCGESHSIPFKIEGKCGSVRMWLIPAPKGTGLCVEKECKKILELAGFKDLYSRTVGQTRTKMNHVFACFNALKKLGEVRVTEEYRKKAGIKDGRNE